jgi:hypothetical protein
MLNKTLAYWLVFLFVISINTLQAQVIKGTEKVSFKPMMKEKKIEVYIGNKYFTTLNWTSQVKKPVLFPILTESGKTITRGYPLDPMPGERADHMHHVGLWLNHESVNGVDYWNNSAAITPDHKGPFGKIALQKVLKTKPGLAYGEIVYEAFWVDHNNKTVLTEETTYRFAGNKGQRLVERITKLRATDKEVVFKDRKDSFLGMRVARELEGEWPSPDVFTDLQGKPESEKRLANYSTTGVYHLPSGEKGQDVWSKSAPYCWLQGKIEGEGICVALFDNPKNPGYPANWHARNYGLFACNNLGKGVFTNNKENTDLTLPPGWGVTFKHLLMVGNGEIESWFPLLEEVNGKFSGLVK